VDNTTGQQQQKKNWFARHKVWTGIIVVFVLLIFVVGSDDPETASTSPTPSSGTPAATPAPTPEFSLEAFYDGIKTGMKKDQVMALAAGKEPTSCSESESQGIGKMEHCSWYVGFNSVSVSLTNGAVGSKYKTGF
jgi:hypothetical protein